MRTREAVKTEIGSIQSEIAKLYEKIKELRQEDEKLKISENGYQSKLREKKAIRKEALGLFLAGKSAKEAMRVAGGSVANPSNSILKAWQENYPAHYKAHREMEWARDREMKKNGIYEDYSYSMSLWYLRDHPPLQTTKD